MANKKDARGYYREKVKAPNGSVRDVYARTRAELTRKVDELRASWAEEQQAAAQLYVVDYAKTWFKSREANMPASSRESHRRHINANICPVIGAKLLAEVTPDDLEKVMGTVAGKSRSTQKALLSTVKQLFSAAAAADLIRKDPSAALRARGKPAARKEALTPVQQQVLLQAVSGLSVGLFVQIGLYAGLRREEILGLTWGAVELDSAAPHITVRQALKWPENHKPELTRELKSRAAYRTVPIPPQLVSALRAAKAKETGTPEQISARTVIHDSDGHPLTYSAFRGRWSAVVARSIDSGRALGETVPKHKIKVTLDFHVTPHLLRHTYITRLILGGVDLKRVQYLAGHDDPQVTLQIYTHVMDKQPEDLIGAINAVFKE